jgi:hypothetical protein
MKTLLLLLSLFVAGLMPTLADDTTASAPEAAAASSAPIDPAKEIEIRKMIQVSGVKTTMKTVMERMFDAFKAQNSALPAEFWTRLDSEMNMDDFIEKLIPIYAKYYSLDDLKAVNAFYASPAGQHMIQVQSQVGAEAMQVGQAWGRIEAMKVVDEIQKEQDKHPAAATGTTRAPAGQ